MKIQLFIRETKYYWNDKFRMMKKKDKQEKEKEEKEMEKEERENIEVTYTCEDYKFNKTEI